MTPRSFFSIVIKVIAIYLILASLSLIPQMFGTIMFWFQPSYGGVHAGELLVGILILLLAAGFYIFFLRLCLFKTDWIIDKLHLDQGFDEERFELNIHRSTVLKIAVIVIGAIMIVDSFPMLCKQLYSFIPSNEPHTVFGDNPSKGWIIYYFAKFFIGFSLMSANRPIVNYIERKRKGPAIKPAETTEE
jgi:hypothetical protein